MKATFAIPLVLIAASSVVIASKICISASSRGTQSGVSPTPDQVVPIGTILAWPVDKVPDGWHICDGNPLTGHPQLRDVLGLTYAPPEPERTNRLRERGFPSHDGVVWLPDFTGCFLRGAGGNAESLGKKQGDLVGPHYHKIKSHYVDTFDNRGSKTNASLVAKIAEDRANKKEEIVVETNTDTETRPVNYAVKWIIRVD